MGETATGGADQTRPIGGAASGPTSRASDANALERSGDRRGERIDRYLVIDRLGSGGMGDVYLAYDPQLDRRVALKLLHDREHDDGSEDGRLLREAQALAKLAHPNVVGVHDAGIVRGRVFVAMEHVHGQTLSKWLRVQRGWREIVATFVAAGRGLAAAHDVGIVHRDFKPGNVMVGEDGRVRVLDFGIARQLGGGADEGASPSSSVTRGIDEVTRTGTVMGTPAFMAPEQFVGRPVTPAVDQFAFCVGLYAALYGARPFAGETYEELAREVTHGRVREPARAKGPPGRVRAAIQRGLAVDPAERWPTMHALIAELERAARPVPTAARIGVVLGGLALAATAIFWTSARPEPCAGGPARLAGAWDDERRAAVDVAFAATGKPFAADAFAGASAAIDVWTADWLGEYEEACAATHVRGEQSPELLDLRMVCLGDRASSLRAITDLFATADAGVVEHAVEAARKLPSIEPCRDVESLKGALRPPDDPEVAHEVAALRVRAAEARALELAGKYAEAAPLVEALGSEADQLGYAPLVAEMRYRHANALERLGRFDEARARYEEAVVAAAEIDYGGLEAQALIGLGGVLGYNAVDTDAGLRSLRHAEAVVTRASAHELWPSVSVTRSTVLMRAGRYDDAMAELALAESRLDDSPAHRQLRLVVLVNLAATHGLRGAPEQALEILEQLVQQVERDLGPHHPTYAAAVMNLGSAEYKLRRHRAAYDHLQRARDVWAAASGPDYPDIAKAMSNQASALAEMGDRKGAVALMREAIERKQAARDRDSTSLAYSFNNLCDLLIDGGGFAEALPVCQQARALLESGTRADHPGLVAILSNLGTCELELGRVAEAVALLEHADRLRTEANLSGPDGSVGEFALARALWAQGRDKARALELARRALARLPGTTHPDHARIAAWLSERE